MRPEKPASLLFIFSESAFLHLECSQDPQQCEKMSPDFLAMCLCRDNTIPMRETIGFLEPRPTPRKLATWTLELATDKKCVRQKWNHQNRCVRLRPRLVMSQKIARWAQNSMNWWRMQSPHERQQPVNFVISFYALASQESLAWLTCHPLFIRKQKQRLSAVALHHSL